MLFNKLRRGHQLVDPLRDWLRTLEIQYDDQPLINLARVAIFRG